MSVRVQASFEITDDILEQTRRAHCSHDNASESEYQCVGSMLITPHGIGLACNLCGNERPRRLWGTYNEEYGQCVRDCRENGADSPRR